MSLPADLTTVTVTGTYEDESGVPLSGHVDFVPSVRMLRDTATDVMIALSGIRVDLDSDGSFGVVLPATDDPDLSPTDWSYSVIETLSGYNRRSWVLEVPHDTAGGVLDIADVGASVTTPTTSYAVTTVVGRTGDVTGSHIVADATVAAAIAAGGGVPYTGATGDVDLGSHSLYADNLPYTEGLLTDPAIVDAAGVTIAVASCEVMIRSDVAWDGDGRLYRMTVPAAANLAVTDNSINYVYVTYNSGSPVYGATTDRDTINFSSIIPVARVYVESGSILYVLFYEYLARGSESRNVKRLFWTGGKYGIQIESGFGISETATRIVSIGSGYVWFCLRRITLAAVAMGGVGVTSYLWYHSGGVWVRSTITQYDNTQYDNGTNLVELTANRYAVNWIYRGISTSQIFVVLGGGDYTATQAVESTAPTVPGAVTNFSTLIGRIIVQKGSSSAYSIENVVTTTFGTSAISEHNDLSGLQGGETGGYYHLTSAEVTAVGTISDKADAVDVVPYTGATTSVDLGSWSIHAGNIPCSEGTVTDPTVTDGTGASVNVTSVEVMIRSDSLWGGDGKLYRMTVPAATDLATTDNALNYIYVDYNGGSPVYRVTTNRDTINFSSTVPVVRVYMSGGNIEYQLSYSYLSRGSESRNAARIFCIRGINGMERESGLGLSETATRIINIGSGYAWIGLTRVALPAVVQGGSGVSSELWYHSGGVWTSAVAAQYDNTQYDDGTDLVALTSNRYAVNWVYRNISTNSIDIILGTGDYTLAQAEASLQPALPDQITGFYLLVGRIIVKAGASTATAIESVTDFSFRQAAVSIHNDLSSIQGGTTGEAYHLTSAQATAVAGLGTASAANIATTIPADSTTAVAGTAGTVSDSAHIHPRTTWEAPDHGLITWTFDPSFGVNYSALSPAGESYVTRMHVPKTSSVTGIMLYVATAGGSLTTGQCYAALYQGGVAIGATADQASAWGSTGIKSMALTGGPFSVPAGDVYAMVWYNGTTGPAFMRAAGTVICNAGLSGSGLRYARANSGLTTLPDPMPALGTLTSTGAAIWMALY